MGAATVVYNPSQSFALSFAQINNSWPQENRPITTESKKVCNVCVGVGGCVWVWVCVGVCGCGCVWVWVCVGVGVCVGVCVGV